MSNSILFHGQCIAGFDHQFFSWGKEVHEIIVRRAGNFRCPSCNSGDVTATPIDIREIIGLPLGRKRCVFDVQMHRLRCHDCSSYRMENLPFTSSSKTHITKALERAVIELREHMSISAVANYYGLDWRLVKNLEKAHLKRKYAHISLREVKYIGVDEIYVGHKNYKTIVRDLNSGSVLHVGDGKGKQALEAFTKRLNRAKISIEVIAMDMASGYAAWARKNLPNNWLLV